MSGTKLYSDYELGKVYETRGRTVTNADIRMWIGATDGTHPNHVDAQHCADHPIFDDIVVPGLLTLSLADAFCAQEVSKDAAFAMNYGHENVRYLDPVYVGDTVSGTIELADREIQNDTWGLVTLDVTLENQDGDAVLVEDHLMSIARRADLN